MILQFALDIPNSITLFNVDDFKQKVFDYADNLLKSMTPTRKKNKSQYKMRSLNELDPVLQELCGICNISEKDLNGDEAREIELAKI